VRIMRCLFFILFILSFTFQSFGIYDINPNCRKGLEEIFAFQFDKGKNILEQEKKQNPENDIPYLFENYIDCFTLIVGEDEETFNRLKDNKRIRLERLSRGDRHSPYYRYCIAEIYIQWAISRIKFREYITAAYELNKAYRLLEKNKEEYPGFIPNMKSLGLLHVLIGAVPDEYRWVTNIFKLDGNQYMQ
jgi:hypothetical protein